MSIVAYMGTFVESDAVSSDTRWLDITFFGLNNLIKLEHCE